MPLLIILGYVWPEPNSSAAGSRMLSLIKLYLAKGWQVQFASPAELSPHRYLLAELGVIEQRIALNCDSFDSWLAEHNPQAVMFDRFMLEEQFGWRVEQACPLAMRILDMEDCHALRDARQRCHSQQQPVDAVALNSELALREIAAIYRCDLTLVISEAEMQLLQQHYGVPAALLCYCPFWLEGLPAMPTPAFDERQHFIAIGNFRHAPNWQAVLWLKQHIWPQIRQQLPAAELHIYGAYPPAKATALHNARQGFLVKGWVADSQQVMRQARVCLAPLAFGAGLKGKLLEAMCQGTPSVTTDIGAEGMSIDSTWSGMVANNSNDIAAAAVVLHEDEQRWQQAQDLGYQIVSTRFGPDQAQLVWRRIEQAMAMLEPSRQLNFTGQMLRHHAYRSTKFMGQWIALKNKLAH
ncbi:MAG: glycosyltransferase [Rheinheimera sp.]|uniref:glycosyltransferase n=1 Tax=Arsukibacterium sp. UBA3155 TaxID=1946058 RepID=UPI000C99788B|nr:glycosyltransferase [Arsukibacterium sp. UBA3155]MAD74600.1 glycosyltransferase [Rheinheimera sp.]|tara:strand:- start:29925 stop:31151 length:1227 start_codon:yes stop_codon:yes gene_type:complete